MKAHKTRLLIFFNNKKNKKMAQTIDAGQTLTGRLVIWDTVADQEVTPGWFTDRSATSDDESIATAAPAADQYSMDFTGVATGTTVIHVTATLNYANSNGAQVAETKTADVEITVAGAANETELRVQF